jgi:Tol biopolymer transport system component/DNA-binding winged helix-turn-helix (wHTH) protein
MSLPRKHLYQFDVFAVDTDQRVLMREGKPLPLAPKVFDTLQILLEQSGRIVSKDELMSRLWPDTFVEDANLTFNIQQLRKSLGDNARKPIYIETIARRGYRFIAGVQDVVDNGADSDVSVEPPASKPVISQEGQSTIETESSNATVAGPFIRSGFKIPIANREQASPEQATNRPAKAGRLTAGVTFLIIIIAGLLVFWRVYSRSALDGKDHATGRFTEAQHLKFEKLTVTGESRQAAISPDGKYLAYTRSFERKMGIWLRQLATNTNVEIVPATSLIYSLAFSNSGDSLYFLREDSTLVLYRVSLVGGVPQRIVERLEGNFAISSDDSRIVFVRGGTSSDGEKEYSLCVVNNDGSDEQTLLKTEYPNVIDVPIWSKDDKSIVCSYGYSEGGGQDVSMVEVGLAGGPVRVLTGVKFFRVRKMAWLPNYSAIIMCGRKNFEDNNQLWHISYPKFEITQITEELSPYLDLSIAAKSGKAVVSQATRVSDIWAGAANDPRNLTRITQATDEFCWTPNGRLVYPSTVSGNWDLWITQLGSTEQRQLTNDPTVDKSPNVTPDNKYVVFTSNRTGSFQLWRMNLDGSDQVQLTNRTPADHASISPDGKWIFYNTTEDWHIWKISIEGGDPVPLIEHAAYFPAVSPDGKMVACLERSDPKSSLSIVVCPINGGPAIKRINFAGGGFSGSRIQWTPDGKALLYAVDRNGPTILLKQNLDSEGPAQEVMDFGADNLFDFGYSPDGKFLAVTRGVWQHDIVLITDSSQN